MSLLLSFRCENFIPLGPLGQDMFPQLTRGLSTTGRIPKVGGVQVSVLISVGLSFGCEDVLARVLAHVSTVGPSTCSPCCLYFNSPLDECLN